MVYRCGGHGGQHCQLRLQELRVWCHLMLSWFSGRIKKRGTCDADVDKRIASATAAFGALKNIFTGKYITGELKGEVYKALVLPTLLYGCEAWSLREDLF